MGLFIIMPTTDLKRLKTIASALYPNEQRILHEMLDKLIGHPTDTGLMIRRNKKYRVCPKCGKTVWKNGFTKSGRQKFMCSSCRKAYSDTSESFLYHTKLSYEQIVTFLHCELNKLSLRETAALVDISTTSAFNFRQKLYYAINELNDKKVSKSIEIDAKFIRINFKGTKKANMPRESKKRGCGSKEGTDNELVCVICAIDENDHIICDITGVGQETKEMVKDFADKHFDGVNTLISDCKSAYETYCKNNNIINEQVKSGTYKNEHGYSLGNINQIHSDISKLMIIRDGVSTRHLQGYLDMYVFLKKLGYTTEYEDQKDEIVCQSFKLKTKLKTKDICGLPMPIDVDKIYSVSVT